MEIEFSNLEKYIGKDLFVIRHIFPRGYTAMFGKLDCVVGSDAFRLEIHKFKEPIFQFYYLREPIYIFDDKEEALAYLEFLNGT